VTTTQNFALPQADPISPSATVGYSDHRNWEIALAEVTALHKPYPASDKQPFEGSGAAFAVRYLAGPALRQLVEHPSQVLGVIGYGANRPECLPVAYPFVAAPLLPIAGEAMFEIWSSASPSRPCQVGPVIGACSDDFAFGAIELKETGNASLEAIVEAAYLNIFDFMEQTGFAIPIRFWNYLASITGFEGALERYRCFNIGRHNAFSARLQQKFPPVASCVGGQLGGSVIYFLAARHGAITVENPRQLSAYEYPLIYGPRSPSFSRASIYAQAGAQVLFISGTASIVGHETRHCGDLPNQIAETMENLRALIDAATRVAPVSRAGHWALKIYLRSPAFREAVNPAIEAIFGAETERLYLEGEICRSDLLVEIEAFHRSAPGAAFPNSPIIKS
jgi:chorismate lyase/3-hydroxybenzoate synthase